MVYFRYCLRSKRLAKYFSRDLFLWSFVAAFRFQTMFGSFQWFYSHHQIYLIYLINKVRFIFHKGSFTNYVDKFWDFFDHLTTYSLLVDISEKIPLLLKFRYSEKATKIWLLSNAKNICGLVRISELSIHLLFFRNILKTFKL